MVDLPKISEAQVQALVLKKKERKAGGSWWVLYTRNLSVGTHDGKILSEPGVMAHICALSKVRCSRSVLAMHLAWPM